MIPQRGLALLPAFLVLLSPAAEAAPLPAQDPTAQAVLAADTALFGASNRCDLDMFGRYLADDLEFYHDVTGLSLGKADLIQKTKNNICGKSVRELVPGSLKVYPLPGYGAIEIGVHRFRNASNPAQIFGEADFTHVWQLKNGAWKLTRVLSYDH